jgi:hypothetical protein
MKVLEFEVHLFCDRQKPRTHLKLQLTIDFESQRKNLIYFLLLRMLNNYQIDYKVLQILGFTFES